MFKIIEPIINDINNTKYNNIKNKEKLEEYNLENENIKLESSVEIRACKFSNIIFDKSEIKFTNLEDSIFINCDLSNINFIDTSFYRVKFINCKLVGTNFIDCDINNLIIEDSMCDLINIAGTKLKNIKLSNSNFKESTFMECIIKNAIITDINFNKSEILNTPLKDIDLSSNNLEGISTDLNSIKGMIINYYQAMDLIGLLGVKIK